MVSARTLHPAYVPSSRVPILTAAIIEKFVIVALILIGSAKRTVAMTFVAAMDGILAVLLVAYLAG